ncbi:lipopolysaccharide biosynthesis protein [Photobacterium kishitanii]|uniref:Polysaccharide biosynthesis protein n=1 Tax=Photobacterium kishitanii TaxID=318456 RepID=A0A2T3KG88_9GAMM|nr:polysaccharide biosynthesis protein [Photobacterium kishitanii]PSU97731.1 polysaccharide biosynthesis protein [Photobacterium kishitanii]
MLSNKKFNQYHLILSVIFTIITGFLSFYINRVFSNQVGQESLGIYRLFTQLIVYLNLAELGVSTAAAALLYSPLHKKEYRSVSSLIYTIDYFYKRIAFAVVIFGVCVNFILPYFVDNIDIKIYLIWNILVLTTASTYLYAKYPILLSADQNYGSVQLIRSLVKIFVLILQVSILFVYKSFLAFILVNILSCILEYLFFRRKYISMYGDVIKHVKIINHDLISKTKKTFIHKISAVLVFNTDYIIIAKFISLNVVAIYSSYILVTQFLLLILQNIVQVIRPKIGKILSYSNNEDKYIYWESLYVINFAGSVMIVSLLYFGLSDIIYYWMGEGFQISKFTLILIVINVFISVIRISTEIIKDVSGYFDDIYTPIIEGSMNLILSLVLVFYFGLNGVILGTIISNIVVILILKPYLVFKNVMKCSFSNYLKQTAKNLIFSLLSLYVISFLYDYLYVNSSFSLNIIYLIILSISVPSIVFLFNSGFKVAIFKVWNLL